MKLSTRIEKSRRSAAQCRFVRNATATAVMAACATSAIAWDYESDGGWTVNVSTVVSATSSWRVQGRDNSLIFGDDAVSAGLAPLAAQPGPNPTPVNGAVAGLNARQNLGYIAGARTDSSELNYDKGDRYQTMFKLINDIEIKKGDSGALIRWKAWYDQAANNEIVPYGHQNNNYAGALGSGPNGAGGKPTALVPGGAKLSDQDWDPLNRFDGTYLLDAYVYTGFDVGTMPAQVRVGRQAVNWGESVYFQGVNQLAPLDVTALRRAGTEIKEALLPVWSLSGNIGLGNGMSVDAYYQLKWERNAIDYCGTYWSPVEGRLGTGVTKCNMVTALTGSNAAFYNGTTSLSNPAFGPYKITTYAPGTDIVPLPKDSGQWALAFHFPIAAIDTEIGLFVENIHSRVPFVSVKNATTASIAKGTAAAQYVIQNLAGALGPATGPTAIGLALGNAGAGFTGGWEYPENIKIYGISAAFNVAGVSVGVEASYQKDVPVQINGNDLLNGMIGYALGKSLLATNPAFGLVPVGAATYNGSGPMQARVQAAGDGGYVRGYDFFNKTQLQVNAVGTLPAILGATNGLVIGEVMAQWNNVPNPTPTSLHYGRAFGVGVANSPLWSGALAVNQVCGAGTNATTQAGGNWYYPGCGLDGFVTDNAWGARVRVSLDYPNFMGTSWVVTPSVFLADDVKGWSMDSQLVQGRKTFNPGLKFNLNKTHEIQLNYTTYANNAKYDVNHDKDNASVSYSYSF